MGASFFSDDWQRRRQDSRWQEALTQGDWVWEWKQGDREGFLSAFLSHGPNQI